MQLIVLGMHRSGTSTVARFLNMMGAYFAPEGVEMPAQFDNPKGHWERLDVVALDDLVLERSKASWHQVARLRLDGVSAATRTEFQARALQIVHRLDAHRPWILKDPRMCLVFPLWRPLLEIPVCVVVHRDPLQVAYSLRARNGIPVPVGVALWERYVTAFLQATRGMPTVLVLHRELMEAPVATLERLLHELEALGVQGLRMPHEGEVLAFLDQGLFHQRVPPDRAPGYLNATQARLRQAFEQRQLAALDGELECSPGAIDTLRAYELALLGRERAKRSAGRARKQAERADALARRCEGLGAEVQELTRRTQELTAQLEFERLGPFQRFREKRRRARRA